MKDLYNDGDAAFIANMGALVEPVTKEDFVKKRKRFPPNLFSHNVMQRSMHNVHAQDAAAKGVLGRIVAAITKPQTENNVKHPPYKTNV